MKLKREMIWFILLPVAIAVAFYLPHPRDMIQAIFCSFLLGLKVGVAKTKS